MTTIAPTAVVPSQVRDPYRFGNGPELTLRPGTMGWSIVDLADPDVYCLWSAGRYEIHDGVLVEMPSSQFYGGATAYNLTRVLDSYLSGRQLKPTFSPEADIQVLPDRIVRGDTVGIWGDDRTTFDALRFPPPHEHWSEHALAVPPTLVIESISQGHEAHDRQTKRRWYGDFGIPHYWIVDGLRRTLDCLYLVDGQYRDDGAGRDQGVLSPGSLPGLTISLPDLWVR